MIAELISGIREFVESIQTITSRRSSTVATRPIFNLQLIRLTATAATATLSAVGGRARITGALRSLPCASATELWFRQLVEVVRPVADRLPFGVEELERLLEDDRRRRVPRDGGVKDVEMVLVEIEADVAARHVGIDDGQLMAGHEVDVMEVVERDLHARLHPVQMRRSELDRTENVDLPVRGRREVVAMMV